MSEKLHVQIITPYGETLSTEVDSVTCPGFEGEIGVLPEHLPLLTQSSIGRVELTDGSQTTVYSVGRGFIHVGPDEVLLLVEGAEKAEDIDKGRAQESLKRAEERLSKNLADLAWDHPDVQRALNSKRRAESRLDVAK